MRSTARPPMPPAAALVYDWLAANGVNEWLPEYPAIVIRGDRIVFTSFVWLGPPDWDSTHLHPHAETTARSVPLRVPPPPVVAALLDQLLVFAAWHGRDMPTVDF